MGYIIGSLSFFFLVLVHGDLDRRILEKTNQIALHPLDHQLYLERGELYLLHEEYLNAKQDFIFCLDHHFVDVSVLIGMSKSLMFLNSLDSALMFAERALNLEENHLSALELKGTLLSRLGKYCEAATTMEELLSVADHPSPALFLETSKEWESCNEPGNYENAIRILKESMNRIGTVGVIQKQIVSLDKRLGRYDDAIRVQTSIIDQSEIKIRPYFERAQLYIEIHTTDLAKEDLTTAISLIDQLPPYKKGLSSIEDMRIEMILLLNQLEN